LNNKIKDPPSPKSPAIDYAERQHEAAKELIATAFNFGNLGYAFYSSLRLFDSQDSTWAKGVAALTLYRLAIARENRRFSTYVRLPRDRTSDEGFEDVLRMLHNMRLSDLKGLSSAFAKTHAGDFSTCSEELALARVLTSTLGEETPADRSRLKVAYRKAFPNSTYQSLLMSKDDPWTETIQE